MHISKLQSIDYKVEEFHIHIIAFQNRDIIPTTLYVEYFTINTEGAKDIVFSTRISYTNMPVYDAIRLQILFAGHLFKSLNPKIIKIYLYDALSYLKLTDYLEPRLYSEVNAQKQFRFRLRQRLPRGTKLLFYLSKDFSRNQELEKALIEKAESKDIIPTSEMLGKNLYDFLDKQLSIRKELGLNVNY